jgi:hypothetical protein
MPSQSLQNGPALETAFGADKLKRRDDLLHSAVPAIAATSPLLSRQFEADLQALGNPHNVPMHFNLKAL